MFKEVKWLPQGLTEPRPKLTSSDSSFVIVSYAMLPKPFVIVLSKTK